MKKIKNFVAFYCVELVVLIGSIGIMSYSRSLVGPMEGQGLASLMMTMHNIEQYQTISAICKTIILIDLLVMIIHYVFKHYGIKVEFTR